MNFKLMMTLRSKYNQGLRTKETLEANRMYLKLRLNGLLKEAKVNITNRHGKEPVGMIDHINGIRDDNRLENLRDVSNSVNGQNKKIAMSSNRIGVLGVRYRKSRISKPYEACIKVNGKNKYLGNYSTPEEAQQAYLTAKRELHEGCTI